MGQAFTIIQIGNPELDMVFKDCIAPALWSCGLDPKRVDKHTEGRLLKGEIVGFIESSDIIVADLTNERPNCYLEVGYAMGLDKFSNLILTAREDHNPDSPNFRSQGNKIHFDLSGYDILFWNPTSLDEFRQELERRIRRRLAIIEPYSSEPRSHWDKEWISGHRDSATFSLARLERLAFMECQMTLCDIKLNVPQGELLRRAREAQIETFGWPIGIVLNEEGLRPRPTTDGIVTEVVIQEQNGQNSFDYWSIRKDGDFYLLKSIFEDKRQENVLFFDTRIVRITETLLYAARLYSSLNVPRDSHYLVGIRHGGLKGRVLSMSGKTKKFPGSHDRVSSENEVYTELDTTIEHTESNLIDLVDRFAQPLFVVFDFYELPRSSVEYIVNKFVEGEVA